MQIKFSHLKDENIFYQNWYHHHHHHHHPLRQRCSDDCAFNVITISQIVVTILNDKNHFLLKVR